ncbi:MAG: glycosyltransferase family 4 protein [Pseudomonadota bacterium]
MNKKHSLTRKPGILQVLPALMSGGVERCVLDTAEGLSKAGFRSFVVSSGGKLVTQLYQHGSRHFDLPMHSKNPFTIIQNIFALKKLIKYHDIDIIHAQSRAPAWSAYYAAKLASCHFVTTIHGAHSISGSLKRFYNSVMTKGEQVVAVSEFIGEYAKQNYEFDHSKLNIIHCGTNVDKFDYNKIDQKRMVEIAKNLRIPTDKPIIMLPGRLTRSKGHLFLLEAIKVLPKNSVTCLFVGDENGHLNYREELQRKINEYGLENNVIITSNVADMPAIYALSDIITCVSTKPEAFGLVSIEAQAMGRMVIVSNLGGIRETIIPNETGWLVEPNNVEDLVNKIKFILKLPLKTRLECAYKAREHVLQNFSLESMWRKGVNMYNKILEKNLKRNV